jgi:hypothetical protein
MPRHRRNDRRQWLLRLAAGAAAVALVIGGLLALKPWQASPTAAEPPGAALAARHSSTKPLGTQTKQTASTSLRATERDIAEWALGRGGVVKPHHHPEARQVDDLPKGRFLIQQIDFWTVADIGDADVQRLSSLPWLQRVSLSRTSITDDALATLGTIETLHYLELNHVRISDAGLERLVPLRELLTLTLVGTEISDRALASVGKLSSLIYLDLSETKVTDAGMERIAVLPNLRHLKLARVGITDNGLVPLSGAKSLQKLDLEGAAISDRGLAHLMKCERLMWLNLKNTSVSPDAVAALRAALPHCDVVR